MNLSLDCLAPTQAYSGSPPSERLCQSYIKILLFKPFCCSLAVVMNRSRGTQPIGIQEVTCALRIVFSVLFPSVFRFRPCYLRMQLQSRRPPAHPRMLARRPVYLTERHSTPACPAPSPPRRMHTG